MNKLQNLCIYCNGWKYACWKRNKALFDRAIAIDILRTLREKGIL